MKLLTAAQMRQLDQLTIEEIGIPSVVLMENAGRTTYQILRREFPDLDDPVVVLAGRGNNGGDGMVVARYLANAGHEVLVLLLAEKSQVKGDAKINLDILEQLAVPVREITTEKALVEQIPLLEDAALLVDALLGTGLSSEVKDLYRAAITLINDTPAPVLAIDIPSGLSADTGQPQGIAVLADVTVTYGWPKLGQILAAGREMVGRLWQVDISMPPAQATISQVELADAASLRHLLPYRAPDSHKGDFGHLFVIAGSVGKTGAATLAGEAAMRVGTGLVTVGVPASLNPILEVKLTEAMTLPLAEPEGVQALGQRALEEIAAAMPGKTALAIGPGLGTQAETVQLVRQLVRRSSVPVVLDADGLYAVAHDLESVADACAPVIMTPHPGEMSRLMGRLTKDIQANRVDSALELAERAQAIVVLKGFQTIIANPDGRLMINSTGNPALAHGGTGDVLTGMIGGFLAQKIEPFEAACLAVYLHGLTADVRASCQGGRGMLASELLDDLPEVIHAFASGSLPEIEEVLMLQARNIMTKEVITVSPQTKVLDLARLLADHKINGAPVVDDEGRLVGVVTQSNLIDRAKKFELPYVISILDAHFYLERPSTFKKNLEKLMGNLVSDIMTAPPVTIRAEVEVDEIATIMARRQVHTLPVLEDDKIIGIIGKIDIIRALGQEG